MSRSRSRSGQVKPRSNQVRAQHHHHRHRCQSINQSINHSINHGHLTIVPPALSFSHIPIQTRGPRPVRYGSCPFQGLFICRPPSISHVTSNGKRLKQREAHKTYDRQKHRAPSLLAARCLLPTSWPIPYSVYYSSHPHISHTTHNTHTHTTHDSIDTFSLLTLLSILHAPIVHLVPISAFFPAVLSAPAVSGERTPVYLLNSTQNRPSYGCHPYPVDFI